MTKPTLNDSDVRFSEEIKVRAVGRADKTHWKNSIEHMPLSTRYP